MKKMKLQMLGLSVNDLLSREQMKKVMGGSGSGSGGSGDDGCSVSCKSGYFACCKQNMFGKSCHCVEDGTAATCTDGGSGSSSCSIS